MQNKKTGLLFTIFAIFLTACTPAKPVSIPTASPLQNTPFISTDVPKQTLTPSPTPTSIIKATNLSKGSPEFIDWSPDGKSFTVAGSLGVHLYDSSTKKEINFFPYYVYEHVQFSPDGQYIGIINGSTVKIIRISDGNVVATGKENGPGFPRNVIFSPDSRLFAYILSPYLDSETFIRIRGIETDFITSLALKVENENAKSIFQHILFDSTGKLLFAGATDGFIYVWNVSNGTIKYTLKGYTNGVYGLLISPDGKLLASYGMDFRTVVWNIDTNQRYRTITGYKGYIKRMIFSPDSSSLRLIFYDDSMLVRNLATGETENTEKYVDVDFALLQQFRSTGGYIDSIDGLAFSPDSQTLATGSHKSSPILLWDVSSHKVRATLNAKALKLVYNHQGNLLASYDDDFNVFIWDTETKVKIMATKYSTFIDSLTFSPDDSILAVGVDGKIDLWSIQQNTILKIIKPRGEWVRFSSFSSNGNILSAVSLSSLPDGSYNFFVQAWNIHNGNIVYEFIPQNNSIAGDYIWGFTNDILAIYNDTKIELLNINSGKQMQILHGVYFYIFGPGYIAFSPNTKIVSTCNLVECVFFDISTGKTVYTYTQNEQEQDASVRSMSFSPDGKFFVVGDEMGNLSFLDVSSLAP